MRRAEDDEAPRGGNHAGPESDTGTPSGANEYICYGAPGSAVRAYHASQTERDDDLWFALHPERRCRLRYAWIWERGDFGEGDAVFVRLDEAGNMRRFRFGQRWVTALGPLARQDVNDPTPSSLTPPLDSIPDDETAQAVVRVLGVLADGVPLRKQRGLAIERVRAWLLAEAQPRRRRR